MDAAPRPDAGPLSDAGSADAGPADAGPADGALAQEWWRGQTFYEVFVRSFQDSDGDGIGDLRGLTSRLDYLNDGDPNTTEDLGIDALWLMPINPTPSYHGYDVTDYRAINPQLGTMEDFDQLLAQARARGIRVIIDLVMNHSSREHPWFRDATQGPEAEKRDWYLWSDRALPWPRPWDGGTTWHRAGEWYYYGLFWSGMPDLNYRTPAVEEEMLDIMRFWLARGVAGFRIDAVRHLVEGEDGDPSDQPETHALIRRLRAALARDYPDALLVAEAWADIETVARYHGEGQEFQLAFNFDLAGAIKGSINDGLPATLRQTVPRMRNAYADPGFDAPFLANHDMPRVMRSLGSDPARARLAAALLFAFPGTPFLYYGEELGMAGGAQPRDEDKRTPMRWTAEGPGHGFTTAARSWHEAEEPRGIDVATQSADPTSLLHLYRDLVRLRARSEALKKGELSLVEAEGGGRGVMALARTLGTERVVLVANLAAEASGPFTLSVAGEPILLYSEGLSAPPTATDGKLAFEGLGGRGFAHVSLQR